MCTYFCKKNSPVRGQSLSIICSISNFPLKTAAMTSWCVLLCVLVLQSLLRSASSNTVCNNYCCTFVETFPSRLKKLRQSYDHIRGFYEANDDLDKALLDQSVENSFESQFACRAMDNILDFYLSTILPQAMAGVTDKTRDFVPHVESIQQIFDALKRDVKHCRHYFSCQTQFDIKTLNSTYTQMEGSGLYKAMSELNLLFNYIEKYLASKRRRHTAA